MFTQKSIAFPTTPTLSGPPEAQIKALASHVDDLKRALSLFVTGLNSPGGLSVVQSGIWTPTLTAGTGTLTTAAATGRYWKLQDDLYFYYIEATVTTAGTGAGALVATLPFTITDDMVGVGADVTVSFKGATVTAGSGASSVSILGADGLTLIADGAVLRCMGFWICED